MRNENILQICMYYVNPCHFDISELQMFCLISTDNCKISVHYILMKKKKKTLLL